MDKEKTGIILSNGLMAMAGAILLGVLVGNQITIWSYENNLEGGKK